MKRAVDAGDDFLGDVAGRRRNLGAVGQDDFAGFGVLEADAEILVGLLWRRVFFFVVCRCFGGGGFQRFHFAAREAGLLIYVSGFWWV